MSHTPTNTISSSAIKRHGGKSYLAERIISLMPDRCQNSNAPKTTDPGWCHYVEPFFGGGAVLFHLNPENISEVVNDLDGELTNFWRVLASPNAFEAFVRLAQATPCSEVVFEEARSYGRKDLDGEPDPHNALQFFIRNRQSRQALERDFSTLTRNRTRRGMNELASAWLSAIDGLPAIHERLKRVVILCRTALETIRSQDGERTLFYLDPPYIHQTRTTTGEYRHEMTYEDHEQLCETIANIRGRFLLSGYPHPLYETWAEKCGWHRVDIPIDNKASGQKVKEKKIECIWMNYPQVANRAFAKGADLF